MTPAGEIVLIDPVHPYAVAFLERARRRGLGTVCLWSDAAVRAGAWAYPALRSEAVTAHVEVDLDEAGLAAVAAVLRRHHRVVAVVPHCEPVLAPSTTLAHLLGLSWAQPEVLRLFRDKHALKAAVAAAPDAPRVNVTALVTSVDQVREVMAAHGLDRVVVKPNDGYGNVRIGFFDTGTDDADIAAHLAGSPVPMLLEEYLEGEEFFVDGQVDALGRAVVVSVGTYRRECHNGRLNVETGARTVRTSEEHFDAVAAYARRVVEATGVRRTPFHLEAKVDQQGPCLIEVAARLVGGDGVVEDSWLHRTDFVDEALRQYLDPGDDVFSSPWTVVLTAPDVPELERRCNPVRDALTLDVVSAADPRLVLHTRALAPAATRWVRRARAEQVTR